MTCLMVSHHLKVEKYFLYYQYGQDLKYHDNQMILCHFCGIGKPLVPFEVAYFLALYLGEQPNSMILMDTYI